MLRWGDLGDDETHLDNYWLSTDDASDNIILNIILLKFVWLFLEACFISKYDYIEKCVLSFLQTLLSSSVKKKVQSYTFPSELFVPAIWMCRHLTKTSLRISSGKVPEQGFSTSKGTLEHFKFIPRHVKFIPTFQSS